MCAFFLCVCVCIGARVGAGRGGGECRGWEECCLSILEDDQVKNTIFVSVLFDGPRSLHLHTSIQYSCFTCQVHLDCMMYTLCLETEQCNSELVDVKESALSTSSNLFFFFFFWMIYFQINPLKYCFLIISVIVVLLLIIIQKSPQLVN